MSFNDGKINPPYQANEAFTHGCAFEHTINSNSPIAIISIPQMGAFYPCSMK